MGNRDAVSYEPAYFLELFSNISIKNVIYAKSIKAELCIGRQGISPWFQVHLQNFQPVTHCPVSQDPDAASPGCCSVWRGTQGAVCRGTYGADFWCSLNHIVYIFIKYFLKKYKYFGSRSVGIVSWPPKAGIFPSKKCSEAIEGKGEGSPPLFHHHRPLGPGVHFFKLYSLLVEPPHVKVRLVLKGFFPFICRLMGPPPEFQLSSPPTVLTRKVAKWGMLVPQRETGYHCILLGFSSMPPQQCVPSIFFCHNNYTALA